MGLKRRAFRNVATYREKINDIEVEVERSWTGGYWFYRSAKFDETSKIYMSLRYSPLRFLLWSLQHLADFRNGLLILTPESKQKIFDCFSIKHSALSLWLTQLIAAGAITKLDVNMYRYSPLILIPDNHTWKPRRKEKEPVTYPEPEESFSGDTGEST